MADLEVKIERYRKRLSRLAAVYGLTAPITVRCSQKLDRLLNELDKKNKTIL